MHLNPSKSLFVASLFCLGSSLPFFPRKIALEPRATYSVVPVDGGSAATTDTSGQREVTIVKTIIETPAPSTQTIVHTDALPPTTDIIISTQTVEGPKATETVDITITPTATPVTVIATQYTTIDIISPTFISFPEPATSQASTITPEPAAPPNTNITPTGQSTSITSTTPRITALPASPTTMSAPSTLETSIISSFTFLPTTAPTSTASYDNGQWHTTYTPWSNDTAALRRATTPPQTSTLAADGVSTDSGAFSEALHFFRRFSACLAIALGRR